MPLGDGHGGWCEQGAAWWGEGALPPEGHVKVRNYRLVGAARAYTPSGDAHTQPAMRKLVARYEPPAPPSPPPALLAALRPPLAAVLRAPPRRRHPLHLLPPHRPTSRADAADREAWDYLQRALLSPSPLPLSPAPSPEPRAHYAALSLLPACRGPASPVPTGSGPTSPLPTGPVPTIPVPTIPVPTIPVPTIPVPTGSGVVITEPMPGLTLPVPVVRRDGRSSPNEWEEASQRLDLLLEDSRRLHREIRAIHEDIEGTGARAGRGAAAARALAAQAAELRQLDELVELLRGELPKRPAAWPFRPAAPCPARNLVI